MAEKSHVSMERHQCFVCGELFDTGSILLDKKLRASMERYTITGTGICPTHQKMIDDEYVILIGATDERGTNRTGDLVALKQRAFEQLFNCPIPPKKVAYVEPTVVAHLKALQEKQALSTE